MAIFSDETEDRASKANESAGTGQAQQHDRRMDTRMDVVWPD